MLLEEILGQVGNNIGLLLSAGLLVGLLHAFEPDHMTAMMTQVQNSRTKKPSVSTGLGQATMRNSLLGAMWGFGHTSMILLVSILVFILAFSIPSVIFDGFELVVGMVLVALGISMYKRKIPQIKHSHPHSHENGIVHTHPHKHSYSHSHTHKSYLIGCLHGLAGSGSLIALSVVTVGNIAGVFSFVLVFGLGSIIGMMIVSGTLSIPFHLSYRFAKLRRFLQILAGTITAVIGLEIIYSLVTSGKLSAFM